MSYEYTYHREKIEEYNCWDIENPFRVDGQEQIYLEDEGKAALGLDFNFGAGCCEDPTIVKFIFQQELTPEQVAILDTTVYNHKNNL
jgi:hypothetical protein